MLSEHPYFGWLGILLKWTTRLNWWFTPIILRALRFRSTGKWWWGILWHYEKWVHRIANTSFFISKKTGNMPSHVSKPTRPVATPSPMALKYRQSPAIQTGVRPAASLNRHTISGLMKRSCFSTAPWIINPIPTPWRPYSGK